MKVLRTFASAICILAGAALLVGWLAAYLVTRAVEDGTVSESAVKATLNNPVVMSQVVAQVNEQAVTALASVGVDVETLGLSDSLDDLIDRLAYDDRFIEALASQVNDAVDQLHGELTDPGRLPAPFVVSFDASESVNTQIDQLPAVGESLPAVALPPIEVELVSADRFEQARDGYAKLEYARANFWWAGLAFLALGLVVSPRRRYVVAKFLAAAGAMALVLALALAVATPERIRSLLPESLDATWGQIVTDALTSETLPEFRFLLVIAGFGALFVGGVAAAIAHSTDPRH